MLIRPSFKKSLMVEQFQGNYLKSKFPQNSRVAFIACRKVVNVKRVNVLRCVNKRNIMAELSQIKELLKTELTPIHAKLVVLEEKFEQLTNSYEFLSAKYNELLEQSKVTNEKITGLLKSTKTMQAEINSNKNMALKTMGETEKMAQYLRRDCLEISGVKPNTEYSSDNIVESIGKVLNVNVTDVDISIAHPLPSYKKDALPKLIVKFTHGNVRNEFYANRKVLAGKNLPADPVLKNFLVGKNIYNNNTIMTRYFSLVDKFSRSRLFRVAVYFSYSEASLFDTAVQVYIFKLTDRYSNVTE